MADYINKNILCQAYVHVEPEEITEELLAYLETHLKSFVQTRAEFFLCKDPEVEIELKDGSIKLYATILGTVTTLFAGVANYPDFREGAILLYEDTKRLADYITTESIYSSKARHGQVIRVEARTGVIGSIRKVIAELDILKGFDGVFYVNRHTEKVIGIQNQLSKLLDNLNSKEDVQLVKSGILGIVNELPNSPMPPPNKTNNPDLLIIYREELKKLKRLLS